MNSPTLLVGLGGTGSKIVAKVSDMITDEQRRNISCVIFDTDANDIPQIRQHNPEIRIVQTSARMTVGEYLEADHYARDNWFPVNPPLDRKVLSEGAGQVRSISRLGFESAIRAGGMDPLYDAISDLYKVDNKKADQALRVLIVSSLAGGTGSGLIVPAAMYIRRYLEDKYHHNANIARGFFILPEVFYDAIPADQRGNLQSNAYASLRELDAFLMKGNKTLSDEYDDSVSLFMPIEGTNKHEEYDLAPYDFCFLFDAQNAKGEKLNSLEQYMDHAANILYSMSIGPMNKRSNSSEDNVLRKLAKERGRNRYAGAGASRLIYPYDDICRLIGLNWASRSITDQWLEYDRQIRRKQEDNQRQREMGYMTPDIDPEAEYISMINADAISEKAFATFIVQTVDKKNQKDEVSLPLKYMQALDTYVLNTVNQKLGGLMADVSRNISGTMNGDDDFGNKKTAFGDVEGSLRVLLEEANRFVALDVRNLAHSIFEGALNEGAGAQPYFIETVIRPDNRCLHPNAVRYFLIETRNMMKEQAKRVSRQAQTQRESLNSLSSGFAYPNLPGVDDDYITLNNYEPKFRFGRKKKLNEAWDAILGQQEAWMRQIEDYARNAALSSVYERGLKYLDALIEAYKSFYAAFETQLSQINAHKQDIYHRYIQAPGMTVRYVAANPQCLDALVARYPYTGSLISIDASLSQRISDRIFSYARKDPKERPNASRYFSALFEDEILSHYQNDVNNKVAAELNQGILKAIELEADLLLDEEQKESPFAKDRYVREVINSTRELATPFIEKPGELNATAIDACAFHESLMPKRGDESYEAKLIQEELVAHGGTGDEDVDRNMIMFYQSYYGLRANSLSKFAPPLVADTVTRNGGEYFKAYSELIRGIHPNSRKSQEITPHIDKSWHLSAKMPDLDEGNQVIEEYSINAAFFWALVLGLLDVKQESSGRDVFSLKNIRLNLEEGALLGQNLEPASRLYEVLEGLSLQMNYVNAIRSYAEEQIHKDTETSQDVRRAKGYFELSNINVPVESHYRGEEAMIERDVPDILTKVSLLELPLLVRLSQPLGMGSEKKLLDLLQVSLREVQRYLSGFCSPDELPGVMNRYLEQEMNKLAENLDENPVRKEEPLMADLLDTAANFMDSASLYELARKARSAADQLKQNH